MEELQLNNTNETCPRCGSLRFWFKYYCNTPIRLCSKCGYFEEIGLMDLDSPLVDKDV